jgi:hypothetical protein
VALMEGIPGEYGPQPWGDAILRGCELLLLRITRRPANHEVRLPGLATTPRHVVEDRTGKALTWRRDGDDLLVTLPGSGETPVIRVVLEGKLRIVPADTATANADGVWDVALTRPTAHLAARRASEVSVRLFGKVTPASQYRVQLAGQSYDVPGSRLIGPTIGPFPVPAARVVTLTIEPLSAGAGIHLDRLLAAPVGTVLASVDPRDDREIAVLVTNFARTPAQGDVYLPLPSGWKAAPCKWTFAELAPGATNSRTVRLTPPRRARSSAGLPVRRQAPLITARLDAGRRSASLPHRLLPGPT